MKKINSITVVGGGTAGCVAALMLKTTFPHINIKLIESSKIGIVGVGESSTEQWKDFCNYIKINELDAILKCNATFKVAVYFENWANKDFVHTLSPPYLDLYSGYYGTFGYLISNNKHPKELCWYHSLENKVGTQFFNHLNDSPTYQYHFDTFALNKFLHETCKERGIEMITDDLTAATLDEETGNIRSVISNDKEYFADFFIDCTGFAKLLLNKTYGIEWKSYADYLPVNSAFVFPTEEAEEYNKQTRITARSAGWSWTVPTQTRTGNGYVYHDSFIKRDKAVKEMETAYNREINVAKEFKFDAGRLEKAWHKNCYAVGLSQSFVEPLEATSIGSIIKQMFCFINFLPSYDSKSCNKHINDIFDNLLDYVQAHYLVNREDTPFWKEVKYNLKLTPNLQSYLEKWKNRLPMESDITCEWAMFGAANYIPILYGLDWFDLNKIKKEYMMYAPSIEQQVILNLLPHKLKPPFTVSHKKIIKEIINSHIGE